MKFDFLPYSAFIFGGRNQRPKAENLRFWPKISASGIPLVGLNDFTPNEFENIYIPGQELWNRQGFAKQHRTKIFIADSIKIYKKND